MGVMRQVLATCGLCGCISGSDGSSVFYRSARSKYGECRFEKLMAGVLD